MAVTDSYVDYIMEQLSPLGLVTARKMFGGIGIFFEGLIFGIIHNDILYFKVDDSNRLDYENSGMKPFKPFDNKPMVMPYFEIPVNILEDRTLLLSWAEKAIEVSKKSPKKKKKKKSENSSAFPYYDFD